MPDPATGEAVNLTLMHEGHKVQEFYSNAATLGVRGDRSHGSMQWVVKLMEELGIEWGVGHPATIRAAEPREQKRDRHDADLILKLFVEIRFPALWLPSQELQDLRALLRHRHQWACIRTRIQ